MTATDPLGRATGSTGRRRRRRPGARDIRLLPLLIGVWSGEAVVLAHSGGPGADAPTAAAGVVALGAAAGVVLSRLAVRRIGSPGPRALVKGVAGMTAAGAALGAVLGLIHAIAAHPDPLPEMAIGRASVTALMDAESRPAVGPAGSGPARWGASRRRWSFRATVVSIEEGAGQWRVAAPVVVEGFAAHDEAAPRIVPGARFRISASARPGRAGRPEAARLVARAAPVIVESAPWWQLAAERVRQALADATSQLPAASRGLIAGLAVGDDSELPEELRADMRAAGLSHLTAVSGANLAIVTGTVLALLRCCRVPRPAAVAGSAAAMLGYVVTVGFEPSVVRAAVMAAIVLVAVAMGRRRAGLSILVAAALALLVADPWLALSWGFALSVAATGALVLRLGRRGPPEASGSRLGRARGLVGDALGVAAWCHLATAPLVLAMGAEVAPLGVVANMAAAPAVPVVTTLGVAAAVLGAVAPGLAGLLVWTASVAADWIARVARWAAAASADVPPLADIAMAAAAVGVAALAGVALVRYRRSRGPIGGAGPGRPHGSWQAAATGAAGLAVALAVAVALRPSGWPPAGWVTVFCDVGQGDAAVVRTSPGHAVVVDVGPEPTRIDRCLKDLDVSSIDLLVLTHFHADHVGGLSGAIRRRQVGRLIESSVMDPAAEATHVADLARESGLADPVRAQPGEEGRVGDASYRVLWSPSAELANEHSGSVPNNSSVTLRLETAGLSLLLPGDLEPGAQQAMMTANPPVGVDVIKIPHHGSRHQDPDLVAWSGARVAVASVGADNGYGHPAPATLSAWAGAGAVVFRTDRHGDVAIVRGANGELGAESRRSDR